MSQTAVVRARIEPGMKKKAERIMASVGLNPTAAIRLFYARIIGEKGIPFPIRIPNAASRAAMRDIEAGRNIKSFDSVEEMLADLKS